MTAPSSPQAAALALVRQGYHVFPCHYPVGDGCSCGEPTCGSMTAPTDRLAHVVEYLADDEAAITDYASELTRDRDSYRLLAQVALAHCHELTKTVRRQKDTIARLHETIRDYISPSTERMRRAA